MARAGQLMLAYPCGHPTKSKTSSNDVFEELYHEAFNPHFVTAELIVAAHLIHKRIEVLRQEALAWQKSVTRNSFKESWIIEGHFHVLYVVGELMRRKNESLEDAEAALGPVDKVIDARILA